MRRRGCGASVRCRTRSALIGRGAVRADRLVDTLDGVQVGREGTAVNKTHISGVGMTLFGRPKAKGLFGVVVDATNAAIADAGIAASDVDTLYFGNFLGRRFEGQGVMASLLAQRLGLGNIPTTNVEGALSTCLVCNFFRHSGPTDGAAGRALRVRCTGARVDGTDLRSARHSAGRARRPRHVDDQQVRRHVARRPRSNPLTFAAAGLE